MRWRCKSHRHSRKGFRDAKAKTDAIAWLLIISIGEWAAAAAVTAEQFGVVGSLFAYSRKMEREADAGSLPMLAKTGYDPCAASRIWQQMCAEDDATAAERKRKMPAEGGMFATHPTSIEPQAALDKQAAALASPTALVENAAEYCAALATWRADFIDDQIKLNDFAATEVLLAQLAGDTWTRDLLYARGELHCARGKSDDFNAAVRYYRAGIEQGGAPVDAWRGLWFALLRSGDTPGGQAALKTYVRRNLMPKTRRWWR